MFINAFFQNKGRQLKCIRTRSYNLMWHFSRVLCAIICVVLSWSEQFGKLINWTPSESLWSQTLIMISGCLRPWVGDWWSLKCECVGPGPPPSSPVCFVNIFWWSRQRPEPATSDAEWRLILNPNIFGKSSSHQDGIMIFDGTTWLYQNGLKSKCNFLYSKANGKCLYWCRCIYCILSLKHLKFT